MEFIYLNKRYSWDALARLEDVDQWLLDVQTFLINWFDPSEHIVVNTSGSTGPPKPIKLLKSAIRKSASITNNYFDIDSSKTAMLCLPAKYIAGKLMIVRALEANANIWIEEPSGTPLSSLEQNIYFGAMTPTQVENVLNRYPYKLDLINTLIIGGGAVSSRLSDRIQNIRSRCYQTYGMTETITHIALQPINGPNQIDHFQVLEPFEIEGDDRGCLVAKAEHIYQSVVITNDIVEILSPSAFRWLGRYDNVINTGGIKVYPEVIESKIMAFMDDPFFIIGVDDEQLGQKVTLCIATKNEHTKDKVSMLNQINSRLTKFEKPRSILFFDCFLYTESGKIQRQKTLEHY